ncbi:hypothetical protein BC567DRAFT_248221 [Phyllosticta citribraziliensis]
MAAKKAVKRRTTTPDLEDQLETGHDKSHKKSHKKLKNEQEVKEKEDEKKRKKEQALLEDDKEVDKLYTALATQQNAPQQPTYFNDDKMWRTYNKTRREKADWQTWTS